MGGGPTVSSGARGGPAPLPAEVAPPPVGLSIPAIGVDERTLVPLGRNPDGTMEVPQDFARAGWFTGGPAPGTSGPAVIAGHVDSRSGPAVFFRLRELEPGDVVTVRLADGRQSRFVVDGVSLYSKDDFPTEAVFGPVPGVALRLITCGGGFDRVARSYRSNVVVYASEHSAAG
jgi:sortase (surface protein transpeptidase)